ncbi:sigma-70 family RNA polymerase sigma factor [Guptibacillus algicola]|uniref:sigma-70 family RNA polymerase sigma factor n=1 Tax=Guptibacillus algicola TaxID=225844 RepID=UPI001CD41071|nr:sigma-70 family RNA polymerase sigma factor [Alkalihalobacillus algicola]MCA0987660.1 sigma-70 family RNA polymerase sigma factor [Alkalihalobacillus algicola]
MEDHQFEVLASQYIPLIKSQIKKLRLTRNYHHYEQHALIALWDCAKQFDSSKGSFSAFAYVKIRGKLIDELRKEVKLANQYVYADEIDQVPSVNSQPNNLNHDHLTLLTANQRKWVELSIVEELSLKEIASREGVSVEAVKSWRKSAITKLRKLVVQKNTP